MLNAVPGREARHRRISTVVGVGVVGSGRPGAGGTRIFLQSGTAIGPITGIAPTNSQTPLPLTCWSMTGSALTTAAEPTATPSVSVTPANPRTATLAVVRALVSISSPSQLLSLPCRLASATPRVRIHGYEGMLRTR